MSCVSSNFAYQCYTECAYILYVIHMMSRKSKCTAAEEATLLSKCHEAKLNSYSPYSKFPVGAALLTKQGKVYTGCNVENSSYPMSVCAERTAIVKAVSEGQKEFKAIAISSNLADSFISPCGSCRQTMAEFSLDMTVYMTKPDGTFQMTTVGELLPSAFTPVKLQESRISNECPQGSS